MSQSVILNSGMGSVGQSMAPQEALEASSVSQAGKTDISGQGSKPVTVPLPDPPKAGDKPGGLGASLGMPGGGEIRSRSKSVSMAEPSGVRAGSTAVQDSADAGAPKVEGGIREDADVPAVSPKKPNHAEELVKAAESRIDEKVKSDQGKKTLGKVFRAIGWFLGLAGSALGLAAGIMSMNIPLIVGSSLLLAKGISDGLSMVTGGKVSIEAGAAGIAKSLGASENTAAWIGFGVGLAFTLGGIGCSLGGSIHGFITGASAGKALSIVSTSQTAVSKTAALISSAVAVGSKLSGVDDPVGALSEEDRESIRGLVDERTLNEDQLKNLKKLVLLAKRYNAESKGRDLMADLSLIAPKSGDADGEDADKAVQDIKAPGADEIINMPQSKGKKTEPPSADEVKALTAQAGRVKTASRVFKVLSGIAVAAGGVLLCTLGVLTGEGGKVGGTAIGAGLAALIKGGVMTAEGIAGGTLADVVGKKHPRLGALVAVIPSIADVVLSTVASSVQVNTGGKLAWGDIPNSTAAKITNSSMGSFATADIGGKVGNVNPRAMVHILTDAAKVLDGLRADGNAVRDAQLGGDIAG